MKAFTVLIISNKSDITTDLVIKALQKRGIDYLRFNTEDFPLKFNSQISLHKNYSSFISNGKRKLLFDEISSVWYRRPKILPLEDINSSEADGKFIQREANSYLLNIWAMLSDKKWINNPFSLFKAERKTYQLFIASKIGFTIPETIVTNDIEEVNSFIHFFNNEVIAKPISHGGYGKEDNFAIFTTDLSDKIFQLNKEIVQSSPFIVQRKIKKKYDIRVTVFGSKIFSHKIEPNTTINNYIDWRKYDPKNLSYSSIKLPDEIRQSIINFMTILELKYGALDFIIDDKDQWYFIEINPNGQFAWLEIVTGDDLINSLINLFISNEN